MSKMADLDAAGVTDLHSYVVGRTDYHHEVLRYLTKQMSLAETVGDKIKADVIADLITDLIPPIKGE